MPTQNSSSYETKLDEMLLKLKACQDEHKLESCSLCEQYLECELRQTYVKSVYESMSKGDTGGFEF
ncbi:MAG: hypothetical protein U9P71_03825 [Campylobacterota bacterium]|nr:hypothetical protein [Campylobacterota bacterium]